MGSVSRDTLISVFFFFLSCISDSEAQSGRSEREDNGLINVGGTLGRPYLQHQGLDNCTQSGTVKMDASTSYPLHALLRCPDKRIPSHERLCYCSGSSDHSEPEKLLNRMSPRVYSNGPSEITVLNQHKGRTSPCQDLGYHTLVTRELPSPAGTSTTTTTSGGKLSETPVCRYSPTPTTCWDTKSVINAHHCPRPRPPQIPLSDTSQLVTTYKGKRLPKSSPFDKLSDDIVLKILSFLSTNQLCMCSRVCRRWYFLTWEPQLWTTVELTGESVPVDRALRTIFHLLCRDSPSICLTVEKVILNGCVRLTDRGLLAIARHCPELRTLELKGCHNITNAGLFELVSSCVNVEHLDVTGEHQCT